MLIIIATFLTYIVAAVTPSGKRGRLVAETPCHKQVSNMLNKSLQLQELQMDVIKESPEKACGMFRKYTNTYIN